MAVNMPFVSSSKIMVLSDFANLKRRHCFVQANNEPKDFQFLAQKRIMVKVNQKGEVEILRIKEKNRYKGKIQFLQKLDIEGVTAVACTKQPSDHVGFGMKSGAVQLYNYNTGSNLLTFQSDNKTLIESMEFNVKDELLATVRGTTSIDVFDVNAKTKLDTLTFDSNVSVARFHRTKSTVLSVGSFNGTVAIYDVQANRCLYYIADAHTETCRDLGYADSPEMLITVGDDNNINFFDTRVKAKVMRLDHSRSIMSMATSECGLFLCIGDTAGQLATFDVRKNKNYICMEKVHQGDVIRIIFAPSEAANELTGSSSENSLTPEGGMRSQPQPFSTSNTFSVGPYAETSVQGLKSRALIPSAIEKTKNLESLGELVCLFDRKKCMENLLPRFAVRRDKASIGSIPEESCVDSGKGIGNMACEDTCHSSSDTQSATVNPDIHDTDSELTFCRVVGGPLRIKKSELAAGLHVKVEPYTYTDTNPTGFCRAVGGPGTFKKSEAAPADSIQASAAAKPKPVSDGGHLKNPVSDGGHLKKPKRRTLNTSGLSGTGSSDHSPPLAEFPPLGELPRKQSKHVSPSVRKQKTVYDGQSDHVSANQNFQSKAPQFKKDDSFPINNTRKSTSPKTNNAEIIAILNELSTTFINRIESTEKSLKEADERNHKQMETHRLTLASYQLENIEKLRKQVVTMMAPHHFVAEYLHAMEENLLLKKKINEMNGETR